MTTAVVWLRQDLRLADNPALCAAAAHERVIPLWIDETDETDDEAVGGSASAAMRPGAASRVWTHHSLDALAHDLAGVGTRLLVGQGDPRDVLRRVLDALDATSDDDVRLYWNRRYDPHGIAVDTDIKQTFRTYEPITFNASLLHEPWEVLKQDGDPYRVYTPYWRSVAARVAADGLAAPLAAPDALGAWHEDAALLDRLSVNGLSDDLASLGLLPERDWHIGMMTHWSAGAAAATSRLSDFIGSGAVHDYDERRNLPGVDGTSRLSPHLHHGELSPRQALHALLAGRTLDSLGDGETTFAKEIVWREFGYSMLYHFPSTPVEPLDRRFTRFPWRDDADALRAWQQGRTGVPIVDAGMRQLYATGWMHNRVRMVVASFLIKNLLIDWREGEAWFRDTLVDADLASNTLGWQWAAGSGADAAPFFRVFNPVLQGEKFDKAGDYTRHWVPELDAMPDKSLHKPWEASPSLRNGVDYPAPLVDLKSSRARALEAFQSIKTA